MCKHESDLRIMIYISVSLNCHQMKMKTDEGIFKVDTRFNLNAGAKA